jgi:cytochrome c oxidase assembly protein subunit 15
MSATSVSAPARLLPSPALRRYAWAVLVYFVPVILWGAVVRATSSGNGCGEHWPLCNGTWLLHAPAVARMIEFAHRVSSGLCGPAAIALALWAWLGTPRGHLARWTAAATAILTMNEAVIGALIVIWGKTAQDRSPARAFLLTTHMANTLLLLGALALTAHLLSRRCGGLASEVRWVHPARHLLGLAAVLLVACTGSTAALGDTLFPAASLASALSSDFSATSNWIIRYRWTHPAVAAAAVAYILWLLYAPGQDRPAGRARRAIPWLLALQCALGVLDVLLLAPVWLQVLHLLGADLVWIALVLASARMAMPSRERASLGAAIPSPPGPEAAARA